MKTTFALLCTALLATSVWAGDAATAEVKKAINRLNDAFAKGDAGAIQVLMTPDHIAVTTYYGKPTTRGEQVKALKDLKLSDYAAGNMQFRQLGKNVVLATYSLAQKGTFRGRPVDARSFASALWVNRDGAWLEAYYQETPLPER